MLKYVDTLVTFAEIPDEITLCINISNCPCHCKGCHSSWLAQDIGEPLTEESLDDLIVNNIGITCVSFMGGDSEPEEVLRLAKYVKVKYPSIKTGWYSGRDYVVFSHNLNAEGFDYMKIGSYQEEAGPLTSPTTNQKLWMKDEDGTFIDITSKFWSKYDTIE